MNLRWGRNGHGMRVKVRANSHTFLWPVQGRTLSLTGTGAQGELSEKALNSNIALIDALLNDMVSLLHYT
jgi:hypothetical protein